MRISIHFPYVETRIVRLLLMAAIPLQIRDAHAQGSLTPPGAPAPGMKTLSQLEPRTPISLIPYFITSSGSYYLTTNLTGASNTNGITISANHVSLDFCGFTLQ